MTPKLTNRQQAILAYCQEFYLENDQLPTMWCIAKKFGFASPNAANLHMLALQRQGVIAKNAVGKWKFAPWFNPHRLKQQGAPVPLLKLPLLQTAREVFAHSASH